MIISPRYYPLIIRTTICLMVAAVCALIYLLFFVKPAARHDPEIDRALAVVDHDAGEALQILSRYVARDSDNAARARAIRGFAGHIVNDRTHPLDTADIIILRNNGREDNPLLARALLAYGVMAEDRGDYPVAVNAIGESADRALSQLADTLLAARAHRSLGYVYDDIYAYDPSACNFSKARDLFDALRDTVRSDICRRSLARELGRSFDSDRVGLAVAVLDSMRQRMESTSNLRAKRAFIMANIQPRLRSGDYEGAIEYGRRLLGNEYYCAPEDSMWAYAMMADAAVRKRSFREARQWIDSAKRFSREVASNIGGVIPLTLTATELALIDSMNPDPDIRMLRRIQDSENDSLFARYKSNIGLLSPSYSMDIRQDTDRQNRLITIIILLTLTAAMGCVISHLSSSTNKLRVRLADIQGKCDKLSRSCDALAKKIVQTEINASMLARELRQKQADNSAIAAELAEYQRKIADRESEINVLLGKIADSESAISQYSSNTNRLRARLADMQNDYDELSRSSDAMANRIVQTEIKTELLERELQQKQTENSAIAAEMAEYQQKIADRESEINALLRQIANSESAISLVTPTDDILPFISAINSIILAIIPDSPDESKPSGRYGKISSELLDYMRSGGFENSIFPLASRIEPGLPGVNNELRSLLGKELHKILLLMIAGFSLHSIRIIMSMKRSAIYRRRALIEGRLLQSRKDYFHLLAEKYIRHNNPTTK